MPVCTAAYNQEEPVVTSDGAGGGVIAWYDNRASLPSAANIYAQRVDSTGNPGWSNNGNLVCLFDSVQCSPCATSDGQGGAIVTWFDGRSGYSDTRNIFGQWIDSSGNCHWSAGGLAVCTAQQLQWNDIYNRQNQIISDGTGGAILVWHDYRNGDADIYAQRLHGWTGVEETAVHSSEFIVHSLKVLPNPFCNFARVSDLPMGLEIKIYDITGRLVKKTKERIIGEKLSSGVYFIRVEGYKTTKVVKLK